MSKKPTQPTGSPDASSSAGNVIKSLRLVEAVNLPVLGERTWIDEKNQVEMHQVPEGITLQIHGQRFLVPWANIRAVGYGN